jgi:hypothetical protein
MTDLATIQGAHPLKFPYGISDFHKIRCNGFLYIDRTGVIPTLEKSGEQLLFLRPRRFGKSLWLSVLENYYDMNKADQFDALFGDLAIGENPSKEHNQYMVLRWDFSQVSSLGDIEQIKRALFQHVNDCIKNFIQTYQTQLKFPIEINNDDGVSSFHSLMNSVSSSGHKLYLLIDEYDNFANDVLMHSLSGKQRYEDLLQGQGIVKTLFKTIKGGASLGMVSRVFITGVSPLVLSDMTSGYNVAKTIYFLDQFHDLCGFTEQEVTTMVKQLVEDCPANNNQSSQIIDTLRAFYNGYRFSENEQLPLLYNPTLAFYFLDAYQRDCRPPTQMLDGNLAMDKGKLKYIAQLPHGEAVIRQALDDENPLSLIEFGRDFGIEAIFTQANSRQFILSLLYFFGVLTLAGRNMFGELQLNIPNLVIRQLYVEQLRALVLPQNASANRIEQVSRAFYQRGDVEPLADFMEDTYFAVFDNRDYRWSNELTIKTAFLSLLFNDTFYVMDSEQAIQRQYTDLTMFVRSNMRQYQLLDFVLEFKFVKLSSVAMNAEQVRQTPRETLAKHPAIKKPLAEAKQQLRHYRQALEKKYQQPERLHCLAVVAIGFERLVWQNVG